MLTRMGARLLPVRPLLILSLLWLGVSSAEALPAFARRYNLPCHFCHDGYPKLSVLGEQFKERGYRLEDDMTDLSDWIASVPVSLRATMMQSFEEEGDAETLGIFKIASAGNLGSRLSYWLDDNYRLDGDGFHRSGVDNLFVRGEILPEELYVRGGRIELDIPFTQARSPQLFVYEIYFANTGFETDNLGTHQDGVELGGFLDETTRWSLAVVKGQNSEEQKRLSESVDGFDANLFGRLMRRFGEGRAGAYFYLGSNALARELPDSSGAPARVLEWDDGVFRLGADGSVYLGESHLYSTFLYGRNSNSFADAANPEGTHEPRSFFGGFIQADVAVRDQIVISSRLELLRQPPPGTNDPSKTFVGFSPGLKLWLHPRVRLAFELSFRNQSRPTRGRIFIDLVL
jgi:hypothetical protein